MFVGISWAEYHQLNKAHGAATGPYEAQGAVLSVAPGRISYTFGLQVSYTNHPGGRSAITLRRRGVTYAI